MCGELFLAGTITWLQDISVPLQRLQPELVSSTGSPHLCKVYKTDTTHTAHKCARRLATILLAQCCSRSHLVLQCLRSHVNNDLYSNFQRTVNAMGELFPACTLLLPHAACWGGLRRFFCRLQRLTAGTLCPSVLTAGSTRCRKYSVLESVVS